MACTTTGTEINLEASSVYWGKEEQVCITPVTGLVGGEHFFIANQETEFYVYVTVDGVGADPAVAGKTGIVVALPASYTVADFTGLFKTAIEAQNFIADISSDALSVKTTTLDLGAPLSVAADVDTGFTIETTVAGIGGSLGKTKDAIEVAFEVTTFDVTSNQDGETLLDKIITGLKASCSMSLLQLTTERLETVIGGGYGSSHTPSGGTSLTGFGNGKVNASAFNQAGKLVLHPVRLADSDRSRDVVFHKCTPLPESINYDGTDSQALSVSFEAFIDENKDSDINIFAIGDWRQDLR